MKKLYTLLAFAITIIATAQAPQGFNYQATVRNSSGALVVNQNVLFKFNIMLNSQTSLPVYSETHQAPTDDLGQVNLTVGQGTPTTGTFSAINWGSGTYYLGIELNTGSGFVAMGTTQLLSVPYALYANSAGSGTITTGGLTHYVGELYGGGIIVSVWKTSGVEHGLIASLTDVGMSVWSNVTDFEVGISAQSANDGLSNTLAIINQAGHTNSAAKLCYDYSYGGYTDWYLPAHWELIQCLNSAYIVNETLGNSSGFKFDEYSCSTEFDGGSYTGEVFNRSALGYPSKANIVFVRAVRKF
jgi:hypothetical protein